VHAGLAIGGDSQRGLRLIVVDTLDRLELDAGIVKQNLLRLLPDASANEGDRHLSSPLPSLRLQVVESRRGRVGRRPRRQTGSCSQRMCNLDHARPQRKGRTRAALRRTGRRAVRR
jgi:hypothetical protein